MREKQRHSASAKAATKIRARDAARKREAQKHGYEPPIQSEVDYPMPVNCECCNFSGRLRLDHCPITGYIRGWICDRCNMGIGLLGDDLPAILKAVAYLKRRVA